MTTAVIATTDHITLHMNNRVITMMVVCDTVYVPYHMELYIMCMLYVSKVWTRFLI